MAEITRENADNLNAGNLLKVVNQVLSEARKKLSSVFDVDELKLWNQMRPNNSKIGEVWDESRNESRKVKNIIDAFFNIKKIKSQKLKSYIVRSYVRAPRSRFIVEDINSCINDYKDFLGKKFSLSKPQKEIVGKLIGIDDENIIGIDDENIISICDAFKILNNCSDKEKNIDEGISNEQVYAKYGWLKEVFERGDLDEDLEKQILSAYKYEISRINVLKDGIKSELSGLSIVGYSMLTGISSLSDDDFVVVREDSNSFPKLNCTFKTSKGSRKFVFDFGYGRWGVELSDICFVDKFINVSDEIQALSDFKEFIEKKVEKRKNGC